MAVTRNRRAGNDKAEPRAVGSKLDARFFEQIAANTGVQIIVADLDLRIVYMNPASEKGLRQLQHLLPCRVEEMIGKSIDLFHRNPEHQRKLLADPKNLPHRAEIRLGDEILDLTATAIMDARGKYLGPMVNWEVITEKVKFKNEQARLKQMIDNASVRFIMADHDLKIVYMNPASFQALRRLQHLLPCGVDDIIGKSIDIFHKNPEHPRRIVSDPKNLPHRATIQLGDEKLDLVASAIKDINGNYIGPLVTWEVITEQERTKEREQQLLQTLAALGKSQANIEFQLDGTIVNANDNFLHAMGYTLDEIKGRHHSMFVDDATKASPEYREFWARLNRGEFNAGRYKRIGKGGKVVWLQATYNPVLDDRGRPVKVVKFAVNVTQGTIDELRIQDEQQKLKADQQAAKEDLERKANILMKVITAAANGDLSHDVGLAGEDDMGRLASGMRKMFGDLRTVIGQVVEAANQQNEGARTIAESSANLSEGAQSQAASVEQMTASVEQLINSIEVISKNAADSKKEADETARMAKGGGTTVTEAVNAMRLIQKSSEQIKDIIQVISEIASQTNLLALNAAIEAARAGEHGLGFAVVADEVRKLAERSSEAAKEITQLIKESSKRVEEGATLSEKVGASLKSIVDAVDKTAAGIARIASSTETQAASATQVKSAIRSVSQTTESNAAAAEEMAASAEELGAQAQSLRDLMARFKA